MASFKVLPGLPSVGAMPEQFSATGQGKHREGYVVEFTTARGERWVGNFQPGMTSYCAVLPEPGTSCLIVIAAGQGYVIDPESRACVRHMAPSVAGVPPALPGWQQKFDSYWSRPQELRS
jgi:hypothetical protein